MLAAIAAALLNAATPAVQLNWYNGGISNIGSDNNCITQSVEVRVQGYAGITYWPPQVSQIPLSKMPAVKEVFYAHLVLSHPGNPCAGSAVGVGIRPAPNTALAISTANPVFCFARTASGNVIDLGQDAGYGCPQSLPYDGFSQSYRLVAPKGGVGGGAWGMAQGFWLEFLVPLTGSAAQFGSNNLSWWVNPDIGVYGYPSVPQYVNGDVIFRNSIDDYLLKLDIAF